MIEGVIFDQDGLLFDTETVYDRCWHAAAEEFGIELPAAFTRSLCGRGRRELPMKVAEWFPNLNVEAYITRTLEIAAHALLSQVPIIKPGVHETLAFCREHGMRTAVASSSPRRCVLHNLESTKLIGSFAAVVAGEDVVNGKPAPDIFLRAAGLIGVKPEHCVVFEDAPSGIMAAHAAGCQAVMVPDRIQPTADISAICKVIPSLVESPFVLTTNH